MTSSASRYSRYSFCNYVVFFAILATLVTTMMASKLAGDRRKTLVIKYGVVYDAAPHLSDGSHDAVPGSLIM